MGDLTGYDSRHLIVQLDCRNRNPLKVLSYESITFEGIFSGVCGPPGILSKVDYFMQTSQCACMPGFTTTRETVSTGDEQPSKVHWGISARSVALLKGSDVSNDGTCHRCGGSFRRAYRVSKSALWLSCVSCGIKYHGYDCGGRLAAAGYSCFQSCPKVRTS